jgi:predicted metalloprotease
MRWTPGGSSEDVEDRRDDSGGGGGFGFGGGGFGGVHLGIGGTLLLLILSFVFKTDFFRLLSGGGGGAAPVASAPDRQKDAQEKPLVEFVTFVLNDAQRTWSQILPQQGNVAYRHAKLVLFRGAIDSGCGAAQSATGPFYCPADEKVYLDLDFFDELSRRFGAPGDFGKAYVIAHELGHHVQKLLGVEGKVRRLQQREPGERNHLSVDLELQADCFAGVWGYSGAQRNVIEQNDVESGLQAAAAVGDDRLQKMATGHVSPESFTHGSSAQRTQWFRRGLDSGQISACNTFQ